MNGLDGLSTYISLPFISYHKPFGQLYPWVTILFTFLTTHHFQVAFTKFQTQFVSPTKHLFDQPCTSYPHRYRPDLLHTMTTQVEYLLSIHPHHRH
jgi:hypothetical protein